MKRMIFAIRLCGYAAGVAGAGLLMWARRLPFTHESREHWMGIGAGLLLVMFLCFLAGYAFYIFRLLR